MRRQLVMGNWKMNGSRAANEQLVSTFLSLWQSVEGLEVAFAPPAVYLPQVAALLASSKVVLAAQDVSAHVDAGAFTGELSGAMLVDIGCQYAIVGHSERRAYHGESDQQVAAKALACLAIGLTPVICVGESLAQRESDETLAVIGSQLDAVLNVLEPAQLKNIVIAYEPVWAIGTGKTASPEQAQAVHHFIRARLGEQGAVVRLLYGGSVKASNAEELFAQADIDGALVGGAALHAEEFFQICQAAF
ncbi:triose-phosphate isomerase [Simiduia curdlanivorans]|uniref:Triosephosphate isomerase n=1 Tax=Simiduia curdlanivorans TaxID=1492769 RepID=A0ABV8V552_9GAMM|nr:triose-phosphate isomerase [Simiduia curdlanivorans]MDN3640895.1 triose-phosphate isomerase [Simiduia curdlanivorans]